MTIYNYVSQEQPIAADYYGTGTTFTNHYVGATDLVHAGSFYKDNAIILFTEITFDDTLPDYVNGTCTGLRIESVWADERPDSSYRLAFVNHYNKGLFVNPVAIPTDFTYDPIEDRWNPVI